ncbi:unnamed protein product [Enterobius vermicularis]|uniref:Uncharacterized protein n=1 Tax=Enterobius vermicularis TaxID=51028 RepID=A0A0N4VNZ6_ENTVE|nr:unnamed protein product [Enterobius vermicularis]
MCSISRGQGSRSSSKIPLTVAGCSLKSICETILQDLFAVYIRKRFASDENDDGDDDDDDDDDDDTVTDGEAKKVVDINLSFRNG